MLTPPRLTASGPPPKPAPVGTLDEILAESGREPARPLIYNDRSVALANLLAGDRQPPGILWEETLFSSRLLEYEIWTRPHVRELEEPCSEAARRLIGRVEMLELAASVLVRALDSFPGPGTLRGQAGSRARRVSTRRAKKLAPRGSASSLKS